jgi:hypothetical protein
MINRGSGGINFLDNYRVTLYKKILEKMSERSFFFWAGWPLFKPLPSELLNPVVWSVAFVHAG